MINNKKVLLILGGVAQLCDIVETAKSMGIHVIATDYLDDSPAKRLADESCNVSTTDVPNLVKLCRDRRVDGIMNYCLDSSQKPYAEICRSMGYPCYGTTKQFDILTNKDKFKAYCQEHGIDIVESYDVLDYVKNNSLDQLNLPVIVKPADGGGSKGITICHNIDDVKPAIHKALTFSQRKEIICERILRKPEICVKYFVCDGEIALTSMSDIYTSYTNGIRNYIWTQIFPSKFYNQYLKTVDTRMRCLIQSLDIKNGPLSFSGFVDDDKFKFIDPSFRLGGAQDWRIVDKITGINISTLLTDFALTGNMGSPSDMIRINNKFSSHHCAMLYFLCKLGKIDNIVGINKASAVKSVIGYHVTHKVGDTVTRAGTTDHVIMRFLLVSRSNIELKQDITTIQKYIDVLDEKGCSLLLPNFDVNLI
jgi:biotin carboxylase